MSVTEIQAKTILRKYKMIDPWFVSRYGMNLYRGCLHDCVYCDGRADKYMVEGVFGKDIGVKTGAPDILARELDPARKRVPFVKTYFMLGGGVGDSYGPPERHYRLTRRILELLLQYGHPVHILTKSDLVMRDMEITIREIMDTGTSILYERLILGGK